MIFTRQLQVAAFQHIAKNVLELSHAEIDGITAAGCGTILHFMNLNEAALKSC
jgi:hypothetical protein